jgi:hypothetical protein
VNARDKDKNKDKNKDREKAKERETRGRAGGMADPSDPMDRDEDIVIIEEEIITTGEVRDLGDEDRRDTGDFRKGGHAEPTGEGDMNRRPREDRDPDLDRDIDRD